ncbi:hypothetical protein CTEN210_03059 [Chaetoceros tenuissimus]|uniref:SAP domain-containing protein n=1 Tax=Chaetoceros tenuissimus TaxID=426638 RepID=A0AAD3CK42_9STRA|nr:hypothetical protein CTEN210_03059 [Chaetoceros tenuissimus]
MSFFPFLFVHRRASKAKKTKKVKKENWFERLKVDELKEICTSANIATKGTKKELIARLMGDDKTSEYGLEGKYGMNMASLKKLCREKNLIQSGTKLALVKRILEKDNGTNPEAIAAVTKRPINTDPDRPTKKRKPSAPDLEKIHNRILKKIQMGKTSKKYDSYHGFKRHSSDVYDLIKEVIKKECFDKELLWRNSLFALQIAKTALVCLSNNFSEMISPGYDSSDSLYDVAESLEKIVRKLLDDDEMSIDLRKETILWINDLDKKLNEYAFPSFMDSVKILKDHNDNQDENNSIHDGPINFEDSKMPAKVQSLQESTNLSKTLAEEES